METAIQEDADAVGLSVLSGAHMTLFPRVIELLAERDAADIVVFGGGIIPEADIPELERLGVAKVFTPGATTQSIVEWVRGNVSPSRSADRGPCFLEADRGEGPDAPLTRPAPLCTMPRRHPSTDRASAVSVIAPDQRSDIRLNDAPAGGLRPSADIPRTADGRPEARMARAPGVPPVHYHTRRTRLIAAGARLVRLRQMACLV